MYMYMYRVSLELHVYTVKLKYYFNIMYVPKCLIVCVIDKLFIFFVALGKQTTDLKPNFQRQMADTEIHS